MKIFVTLGDIIGIGILMLFIIGGIIYATVQIIVQEIKKIGKKNCYGCKYYDLYDVASAGGYCRMKCKKHNRIDNTTDMNEREHYEKCKDFKSEVE